MKDGDHTCRRNVGDSGEKEHGNNSVICVRTGPVTPALGRVGMGHTCDEPW